MKLYWILFSGILLLGIYVPCEGFLDKARFQDFVDKYVDVEKFKEEGIRSLNATAMQYIWNYFKTKFLRHYSSSEEEKERLQIFRAHLKRVLESNIREKPTFQLGLNEYADLTEEEFKSLKTGLLIPTSFDDQDDQESVRRSSSQVHQDNSHLRRSKRNLHRKGSKERRFFSDWFWDIFNKDDNDDIKLPDEFDWRTKGVVSGIKNQEGCGSCYAFATTAVMESLYAIKTQSENVTNFSPQQIVDCSSNGNSGCHGGLFEPSVKYLSGQGGKIATEDSYPYVGREETCKTAGVNQINLGNIESGSISKGNEKKLAKALVKYGPIFIGLNYNSDLRFYKSGILNVANCPNRRRDMGHALTLVGYGYDNALQKPYWIIKNSWGATDWGENGYLRLAKDAGNMCGVATMASYAKLT